MAILPKRGEEGGQGAKEVNITTVAVDSKNLSR